MKGIESYFSAVLFIMLKEVVLIFESLDESRRCGYSNESNCAVISYSAVHLSSFHKIIF